MPIEVDEAEPRPLPVVLLTDTSGSMGVDGKIDVLNDAVGRMIGAFAAMDVPDCRLLVAVVAFGGESAEVHLPLRPANELKWEPLTAAGRTPMGGAFEQTALLLADSELVPRRSYKPHLVLVSDGIPTDDWRGPLERLNNTEQAKRALRFAVGIGADMKHDVLRDFAGEEGEVVPVEHVEVLTEFFKFVTHTVSTSVHQPPHSQADVPTFDAYAANSVPEF